MWAGIVNSHTQLNSGGAYVNVPGPACSVVGSGLFTLPVGESENDGVSHGTVARVKGNACANAVLSSQVGTSLHLSKHGQTLLSRAVTSLAGKTVLSVSALNLGIGVIGVGVAVLDHLLGEIVNLLEVVTGVGDLVVLDVHQLEIMKDSILKLLLLLGGVCVVESNDELSVSVGGGLCEVIVEKSGLGVANVKVATRDKS
jgi:hypothetical protein